MSATDEFLTAEDVSEMVADLKEWPNYACGDDEFKLAVSPFLSFYFDYALENFLGASLSLIETHEAFEVLTGKPFTVATHPDSERPHPYGSKRLGDLRKWASKTKLDEHFCFKFTDEGNHRSSPSTAGYFWRNSGMFYERDKKLSYSYAQFYYRWQWWMDNREAWRRFVHATIERLRPEQVYSGFAMANPLQFGMRSEVTVWDRALTPHFYGLDTDYPFGMDDLCALRKGIRPPTWGFFLSDIWRAKLDKTREQVRGALDHPLIRIDELSCGQWIELGEPSLYPVEQGVPLLPVMLNQLLRPIRHPQLDLLGFGEWDGDPNVRFNAADTRRWLGRFDPDSDWPDAATRARSPTPSAVSGLRVRSGTLSPYPAVWECLERPAGPQTVAYGEPKLALLRVPEGCVDMSLGDQAINIACNKEGEGEEVSATDQFLTDEDVSGMVEGLKEWPNYYYGNDESELAVSPFLTFYFDHVPDNYLDASMALIETHEAFEALAGRPYTIATHPDSERPHPYGSKRLGDLREWASKTKFDKAFQFSVTDEKNHRSSPTTGGNFWRSSGFFYEHDKELKYSYAQFYYRWQWWMDNREAWRRFVHATIERLKPEQVYSGFAMANPLEFGMRSEVTVWDRALTPHFYGLDTDYPFTMDARYALRKGIRPPTWGFFLSDIWRAKLGKTREQVHGALDHPSIRIDELSCGQWIELGEPNLYPVEQGVPLLPVMLNQLLRPIRHPQLDLLGFGEWDGDPNVRFNAADTRRWLGRFDPESDWPDAATRARSPTPSAVSGLRVRSGAPSPYPAVWECLERPVGPQTVAYGEPMPKVENQTGKGASAKQQGGKIVEPSTSAGQEIGQTAADTASSYVEKRLNK